MKTRFGLLFLGALVVAPTLAPAMDLDDPARAYAVRKLRAKCSYGDDRSCYLYEQMQRNAARVRRKQRYYGGYDRGYHRGY